MFVGILTALDDEEGVAHYRGELAMVTATLKAAGLPTWHEPDVDPDEAYDEQMYGYYVPVDFQPVIIDERVSGGYLGSSHRLLDECLRLARLLELPDDLDPWSDAVCDAAEGAISDPSALWQQYRVESFSCLRLIAAARTSISTGAAITFA
ncbi:hypothetical protein Pmi06nite_04740 [Planotetraspora mira]|uniref:Uncharacterized protein n=1 Tax=Planotetraspora mira TaxID=58121 RepID=A0A8J3TJX1_9ACTN|nr:hypothetical protein Pmi06nite_04740 [Planotetraspora mira]